MGFGIEIKNSSSELQIDGRYRNMVFYSSGSVYAYASSPPPYSQTSISLSGVPTTPLVALRPDTNVLCFVTQISEGDALYLKCQGYVDYKIFCESFVQQGIGNYGLKIYNESGNLVYDSRLPYMKILGVYQNIDLTGQSYIDINHSGIVNPFYILTNLQSLVEIYRLGPNESIIEKYIAGIIKTGSESVRIQFFLNDSGNVTPGSSLPPKVLGRPMTLLLVDV